MGLNNIRMYYHSYLESLAEKSIQESFPIVLGEEILNTDALRLLTIDSSSDYSEVGYTLIPSTNEVQHSDLQKRFGLRKMNSSRHCLMRILVSRQRMKPHGLFTVISKVNILTHSFSGYKTLVSSTFVRKS